MHLGQSRSAETNPVKISQEDVVPQPERPSPKAFEMLRTTSKDVGLLFQNRE